MDEITQVNEQLAVYIQEKRELDKLNRRLAQLALDRTSIEERMVFIKTRLAEEKADVDRLNKLQKIRLLTPNDRQEAQYDKEVQEYETVLEHRNQGLTMLSDIEIEERQIHQRIAHIGPIEEEYATLVKMKERLLRREGGDSYLNLIEKLENLKIDHKELQEAIAAGEHLSHLLERMSKKLENHYNSEYLPDNVEKLFNLILGYLPRAQVAANQFCKEVRDVEERLGICGTHSFQIFMTLHRDFVVEQSPYKKMPMIKRAFATLFEEPYWERRINTARNQLYKLRWALDKIMQFLTEEMTPTQQKIEQAKASKQQLIETIS
ncbi:MAG: hypothetical protein AB8H47_03310 [Bacteroidia bacterium]